MLELILVVLGSLLFSFFATALGTWLIVAVLTLVGITITWSWGLAFVVWVIILILKCLI